MANVLQRALVGVGQVLVNAGGSGRRDAAPEVLDMWVREKFGDFLADGLPFTAFEITTALRNEHPDINIRHVNGVRELVHELAQTEGLPQRISDAKGGATVFFPEDADLNDILSGLEDEDDEISMEDDELEIEDD